MPAIRLPSDFPAQSTMTNVSNAVASFVSESRRADVFVEVRLNNPLFQGYLTTSMVFYPPPTIYPAIGTITVVVGETMTLTIKVS